MQYTVKHPDGSETTHWHDAGYIREDEHQTLVLSIARKRVFPQIAKRLIPDEYYVKGVAFEGDVKYDHGVPPEIEDNPRAQFVVSDQTGARATVYVIRHAPA